MHNLFIHLHEILMKTIKVCDCNVTKCGNFVKCCISDRGKYHTAVSPLSTSDIDPAVCILLRSLTPSWGAQAWVFLCTVDNFLSCKDAAHLERRCAGPNTHACGQSVESQAVHAAVLDSSLLHELPAPLDQCARLHTHTLLRFTHLASQKQETSVCTVRKSFLMRC